MEIKTICRSVNNPEGPVGLPDGSWVFTEMDVGAVSRLSPDGVKSHIFSTKLPNGLALGADGRLWIAEADERALVAVDLQGAAEVVSIGTRADPFLLPNDLCFGPDGLLYMTDSGILRSEMLKAKGPMGAYDLAYDGRLYVINPVTGESEVLDRGYRLTNGIAFGPGGEYLYLAETLSGKIFRYKVGEWKREFFGSVMKKPPMDYGRVAGPDGMAFDTQGNLYVAVIAQDVCVLAPDGSILRHIALPGNNPTNLAFHPGGEPWVLVTEAARNELLMLRVEHPGLPLYTEKGIEGY